MVVVDHLLQSLKPQLHMLKMVSHLECPLFPFITTPIVEECSQGEEAEVFVVEVLVQGLIEVEDYHEEGSEVVEVEDLLLLKLQIDCY
jgi:hypothetical protein